MKNVKSNIIFAFIILGALAILGRLFFLQVIEGDKYRALALGQTNVFKKVTGDRGEIFLSDKSGNALPLALNKYLYYLYSNPSEVENKEETAKKISEILKVDEAELLNSFNANNSYLKIKDKLSDEEYGKLKDLNIQGIYLGEKRGRYYPQGELCSKVVGFINTEEVGQYGLERQYESLLQGKQGVEKGTKTSEGEMLSFDSKQPEKGKDLVLSIDYNIQSKAEKLLTEAKKNLNIEGGEIIVMEPRTGRILALSDFPNFDPNNYIEYAKAGKMSIFQNSATEKLFEPGSIFKPITMAAALNEGKITPDTEYTDEGFVKIDDVIIQNFGQKIYGLKTMTQVLENSINTGAVFALSQMGNETFLKYLEKFKIFTSSGIDLPETYSQNRELKKGYRPNFAAASFGQSIEMTPIKMLQAFSVIANNGIIVYPQVVDKTVGNGTEEIINPKSGERIISVETAKDLTGMLVSAINNGFSRKAKINGYYLAGKTGTAQVSYTSLGINKKGYSDEVTQQSFIGFGPAYNPKFLILITLNNPEALTAEYSALPIFRELAKYIIDYYEIPPDFE